MLNLVLIYAAIGVSIEISFNSIRTFFESKDKDLSLKGSVSIWMLPIYGLGLTYGFDFIHYAMSSLSNYDIVRWLSYPLWIWALEVAIGIPTKNKLWDYTNIKYNWKGVISLAHYPAWVMFGIIIENIKLNIDYLFI